MIELPPVSTACPFCASVELYMKSVSSINEKTADLTFYIHCNSCQAHGPVGESIPSAALQWDRAGRRRIPRDGPHPLYPPRLDE